MNGEPRTYVTMAGKSIGKCSSGHWLPLKGDCDLCGAGYADKCRFQNIDDGNDLTNDEMNPGPPND